MCIIVILLSNFLIACSFRVYQHHSLSGALRFSRLRASENDDDDDAKPVKKELKSTKFDRAVDDFLGKRYGAGQQFYGKRVSDLSEEEYATLRGPSSIPEPGGPMKDNAILIIGDIDNIGQLVAFELAEKGFSIRMCSEDRKDLIEWYGVPGDNVDMVALTPSSSEKSFDKAIEGVQAIVICGNFYPEFSGSALEPCRRFVAVASKLLATAAKTRKEKGSGVQKVVQISRALPWTDGAVDDWRDLCSGGPVLNPVQSYFEALSGTADSASFEDFRSLHSILEKSVRGSGFEYVIVRAPPTAVLTRAASRYELKLLQTPADLSTAPRTQLQQARGMLSLVIGNLDLAETATQALLSDCSRVTFTVCEDPEDSAAQRATPIVPLAPRGILSLVDFSTLLGPDRDDPWMPLSEDELAGRRRPPRNTYYSILNMSDQEMQESYVIRSEESYVGQLTEDERVERYWSSLLRGVKKDV